MTSQKKRGSASRKVELARRQDQRLAKRDTLRPGFSFSAGSLELRPKIGPTESIADAAIFNKECRLKLSDELQLEASKVIEALELTRNSKFDEAIDQLKEIPRSSPFADWRLFIRGLHSYYSGELEAARQNWTRLDRARRPARIGATLLLAEIGETLGSESPPISAVLVEHAKTLRFRKEAIAAATAIAQVRHRDPDTTFSVSQSAMLSNFRDAFSKLDTEFVSSVSLACVQLSVHQGNWGLFERLVKTVPGPPDDPNWNRTKFLYATEFQGFENILEKVSKAYINHDLPRLTELPEELKNALACKIFLVLAEEKRGSPDASSSFFSFRESKNDYDCINELLRKAIERYPKYRPAHEKLISSLEDQLDEYGLSKSNEERLEKELVVAEEKFVQSIPDEIETALSLIDFYLEEDQLDKANALVQRLSGQRLEDPLAKALPWKLKLREAMRLSRRKTDLALANKALDDAESLWPTWLNRNWLPFLRAALTLRSGDIAKFKELKANAIRDQRISDFVGNFMAFAALQQMNIPSPDLKPFRTGIDLQIQNASKASLADLFSIGAFFWDLVRTGLEHKGYRLQSSKLGRAFADQLNFRDNSDLDSTQIDAFCWAAHHRFWPLGNDYSPKPSIKNLAMKEARIAATVLKWLIDLDSFPDSRMVDYQPLITLTKEAARNEKDPFYRYQFDRVADEAIEIVAEVKARQPQRRSFASTFADEDQSGEEEDDELDDECDCASCRAERAGMSGFFTDEDEGEDDDDDEDEANGEWNESVNAIRDMPPIVRKVTKALGPRGMSELDRLIKSDLPIHSPEEFMDKIGRIFSRHRLSMMDAIEFVMNFQEMAESGRSTFDDVEQDESSARTKGASSSPTLTAEERKSARKQREKELEKKKGQASQNRSKR